MFKLKNKEILIVVFFFIIVSIITTYPLIKQMNGFLDLRLADDSTTSITKNPGFDGKVYVSHLESGKEKLFRGEKWYEISNFEMPISYLIFGILVMSIFKVSSVFAHNLMFLLSIILSGLGMYFLAYRFTKNHYASIFAGYLYCTSNYIFAEFLWGHGNQVQLQWIPLIFLFLDKILMDKENKLWNSVFFGSVFRDSGLVRNTAYCLSVFPHSNLYHNPAIFH